MPLVGCSIDRRTFKHIKLQTSEDAIRCLVCMCCARVLTSSNGESDIAYINMEDYFNAISGRSFEMNWDFNEYRRRYAQHGVLQNHPDLQHNAWVWRRKLLCSRRFKGRIILCCPEDAHCKRLQRGNHSEHEICHACFYPICSTCRIRSSSKKDDYVAIPQALANDNFWGYATDIIYKYRVRWIESAAACPVFTCLITYYVEGIWPIKVRPITHQGAAHQGTAHQGVKAIADT